MITWKVQEIYCPECLNYNVFYKWEMDTSLLETCWTFFCECNDCGCIWEEDIKRTEFTNL